jgi:phosphopantetheinyl transferase
MPLQTIKTVAHQSVIWIWHITESEAYFRDRLQLFPLEINYLNTVKSEAKRIEWLASRWLLQIGNKQDERIECIKDKFGKPFLVGSNLHISMSHSHQFTAVLLSPKNCGIDIQKPVSKIKRIAHKFCSGSELDAIKNPDDIEALHIYWGAKESIFKAYGKKKVNFKEHMQVELPIINSGKASRGVFKNDHYKIEFEVFAETMDAYYLVYTFEIDQ